MASLDIVPSTFRFLEQCFNQLRYCAHIHNLLQPHQQRKLKWFKRHPLQEVSLFWEHSKEIADDVSNWMGRTWRGVRWSLRKKLYGPVSAKHTIASGSEVYSSCGDICRPVRMRVQWPKLRWRLLRKDDRLDIACVYSCKVGSLSATFSVECGVRLSDGSGNNIFFNSLGVDFSGISCNSAETQERGNLEASTVSEAEMTTSIQVLSDPKKTSVFWETVPHTSLKFNRLFVSDIHLHSQRIRDQLLFVPN
jgi:hypothetical protein